MKQTHTGLDLVKEKSLSLSAWRKLEIDKWWLSN
jgi:hypothetical protein